MLARAYFSTIVAAVTLSGCHSSQRPRGVAPRSTERWWGCYVLTWTPTDLNERGPLNSIRLVPNTNADSSATRWRVIPYFSARLGDLADGNARWDLRGDTLEIFTGPLSGWSLRAVTSRDGFTGRAEETTDQPGGGRQLPVWTVVGRRSSCET
jgi:hypothetical protein